MITRKFQRGACFAVASLFMLGGSLASADIFTSTIDQGNTALSGNPGPYGTVMVDLTSPTMATITFTSDTGFLFGDSGSADVNINATTFTESIGTLTGPFTTPTCANADCFGSGQVDAQGNFNLTTELFDGYTNAANSITFTVTNTSGTWSSAANVLAANGSGLDAAAHVFVCSDPTCSTSAGGALATGFAGEVAGTGTAPTPEPASIAFLATSLLGAGVLLRRKMQSKRS